MFTLKTDKEANKMSQEGVFSPSIYGIPQTSMRYVVSITDNISDVFIYDEVLMLLETAEEQDEIVFNIASYGGQLASLLSLRSGILSTKATVTGKLVSHACSAAGMLLLSCHNKVIYPNTTFHAHTASYGSFGKSSDIKSQVDFETKQIEKLMYEVYAGFLDAETEIPLLLEGKEFYFNDEETSERLNRQQKLKNDSEMCAETQLMETTLESFSDEELEEELEFLKKELKKRKSKKKVIESENVGTVG